MGPSRKCGCKVTTKKSNTTHYGRKKCKIRNFLAINNEQLTINNGLRGVTLRQPIVNYSLFIILQSHLLDEVLGLAPLVDEVEDEADIDADAAL